MRIAAFAFIGLLMISGMAPAQANESIVREEIPLLPAELNWAAGILHSLNEIQSKSVRTDFLPAQECPKIFGDLLKKDVIRIDYFSGYYNNLTGKVFDRADKQAMTDFLSKPCPSDSDIQTCGFQQDPQESDLFVKSVIWPDGSAKKVEVRLANSSISYDDRFNQRSPLQPAKSKETRQKFIKAAAETDVLIYSGHSRYGYGPDFFRQIGGHDFYQKNPQGFLDLKQGLSQRKGNGPAIVSLASCDSRKYFGSLLGPLKGRPRMAILAYGDLNIFDYQSIVYTFESVLRGACPNPKEKHKNFSTLVYSR